MSTPEQDHAAQVDALNAAGAVKVSVEKLVRRGPIGHSLRAQSRRSTKGDLLAVVRIDGLARSSCDLLNIVHEVEGRGATFESLAEPWANTNSPQAAAMLTMLSAFAQLERAFILARTKEGRERARAQGCRFGPKPKLSAEQIAHARDLHKEGLGLREIGALVGCHASTVSRALQIRKQEEEEMA